MIGNYIGAPIGGVINTDTGNTGFLAVTLDDATGNATGTLAIRGKVGATLGDATLIATGALALAGSAGITLSDITIAATGSLDIAGGVGTVLDDATLSATMARDPQAVLGIVLDDEKNEINAETITTLDSQVKVLVIPTNEELVIAEDTYTLIKDLPK